MKESEGRPKFVGGVHPPKGIFDDELGKTEAEAIESIKARKWQVRVRNREGEALMGTCDFNPMRANLSIMGGKVVRVTMG